MTSIDDLAQGLQSLAQTVVTKEAILAERKVKQAINDDGSLNMPKVLYMGSRWDGSHIVMGLYHLWIDEADRLRMKKGAPTSDTDGQVVGGQT